MLPVSNVPLETQLQKLNLLVEVSLYINSTLELEPLLRKIMDTAAALSDSQSASILLVDNNTQELHFMAFDTKDEFVQSKLKRIPVPLKGSIAGTVVLENRPIVINDVENDPRHYRKTDDKSGFHTDSLLGIPMRIKERVVGVLEAVNKNGDEWTDDDVHFLEILASQAAIAVENASLVNRLREAYQELSQLDKLKNDFIAIASHELRTPLGVILGYATFLREEAQGEASEHAAAVLNSALKMRQLIEDMTNLRFIKVSEGELHTETIPVCDLMDFALKDLQAMAEAQETAIDCAFPAEELCVSLDRIMMTMAITNLLNNAIKFSEKGKAIQFMYEEHPDEVWLIVKDQGSGIPSDQLERIFEEFYQIEDHMTRRHNGMGLGLSIVKAVVTAHRGRVWADSAGIDKGSTFYLSLPLEK